MKRFIVCGILWAGAMTLPGQESDLNVLKQQILQQQKTIDLLLKKVEALEQRQAITNQPAATRALGAITNLPAPEPAQAEKSWSARDPLRLLSYKKSYVDISFDGLIAAGTSTAEDVESLQLGGHDPRQRGFTVQNLETVFQGKVDPYFRGQANIIMSIDPDGETIIEAEEAFMETLGLPWNLQLRAGQYLTEFGRLNATHPHSWGFVDQPLVNGRFLGPDGLRNPGMRLGWLMPTPFYSELLLSVQNSHGETASSFRSSGHSHGDEEEALPFALRHPDNDRGFHHVDDVLFTPRWVTSYDLTDAQTLLLGASAAFGPNSSGSDGDTDTQIYGTDLTWKWKPTSQSGGFPFVQWQTEAMLRRYKVGAFDWDEDGDGSVSPGELEDRRTGSPAVFGSETLTDLGIYSQLLYGFKQGWVAGLRFDHVWGERANYEEFRKSFDGGPAFSRDPMRETRWRLSPNLTWYPSEFSKIRLQYNYDDRRSMGADHSVWLQFEFLLGAHGSHQF